MKVRWAEQQVIKSRVKRIQKSVREHQFSESNHQTVQSDSRPIRSVNFNLNDPGWIHMWYLVCIFYLILINNIPL